MFGRLCEKDKAMTKQAVDKEQAAAVVIAKKRVTSQSFPKFLPGYAAAARDS